MSFATQFHAPGAFPFDTSRTGQALHANIFRPPESPSASSYNLAKSTGSLYSDISMSTAATTVTTKRKRANTRESTPLDWNMNMDGASDARDEEKSREFRYTLAGQISTTPACAAAGAENGVLEDSAYSDVDYRRALGPKTVSEVESPVAESSEREKPSAPPSRGWSLFTLQTIGDMMGRVWDFCKNGAFRGFHAGGGTGYTVSGSTVTETTGGPWNTEQETPPQPAEDLPMNQDLPEYVPQQPTPSPYSPVYHDFSTPESTPRPAAKRRQVSANNDEFKNWVMVDEPSNQKPRRFGAEVKAAAARSSGLVRPRSGYYAQTAASTHRRITAPSSRFTGGTPTFSRAASRPSLRISHAGSPNLTHREPASFASPRSSPVSRTTPSRIPVPIQSPAGPSQNPFAVPSTTTSSATSSATSMTTTTTTTTTTSSFKSAASRPSSRHSARLSLGSSTSNLAATGAGARPISPIKLGGNSHRRNQSGASTAARRQSLLTEAGSAASPRLDAEARQLAQRKLAAERDADARVDAFNAKLLSMIRQGREALGTKVEVEMEEEGGDVGGGFGGAGWEDDD
ncbi:hypothetical protein MFIFM68171_09674 [Madurella fahalii]|uniref:Uncharacterized protein n=1 Tax=Madurella fahalii TaxID=1157608 RepID=A0ABQ0GP16_9PEZI